jgi:molecular chaperone GrpE
MRFAMNDITDRNENDDLEPIDEDTADDAELEDIEENSAGKIKKLQQKLKQSEQEKMEHLESLQRAKAEFLNAKRRLEDEKLSDRQRAITDQIEKLLPMCDSFHMAMSNKEAWENIDSTWRKGIESIYNQLQSILASYGVKEVTPLGEEFDPNKHEAMTNVPVDSKELHHKVISVIQNGFVRTHNGKEQLIRPARVTVGEYAE